MTQIETLYFNGSIAMPIDTVVRVIGTGFVRALIFAPLAVLVLGKFKGTSSGEKSPRMPAPEWVKRFAFLSVVIFPNPFMPPLVRQGHLYELSSSMFTFGVVAGWVWTRQFKETQSMQVLDAKAN